MDVIKYILFASISTFINLLLQYLSFHIYMGFGALYISMFLGTLFGLLIKYILDKKYIFYHTTKNTKEDAKKFIFYSFMGIFTTVIFWGTELGFYMVFDDANAKYFGAVIGLIIGYIVKYYIDKKYVFIHKKEIYEPA